MRRDATPAPDRSAACTEAGDGAVSSPGLARQIACPQVPETGVAAPRRRLAGCPDRLAETLGEAPSFCGALLRSLRCRVEAGLDEVAAITKVQPRYLQALEEDDFDSLPAPVYVRGFIGEYARALGLDGRQVADSYMQHYRASSRSGRP